MGPTIDEMMEGFHNSGDDDLENRGKSMEIDQTGAPE